jgi:type III pantothenate kinase
LVKPSGSVPLTGKTTKESIISGVQLGILNEMEGYIRQYSLKYKGLKVILTGGDAVCFAHLLNFPIFAAPKLTAIGLNEILQHNLEKK